MNDSKGRLIMDLAVAVEAAVAGEEAIFWAELDRLRRVVVNLYVLESTPLGMTTVLHQVWNGIDNLCREGVMPSLEWATAIRDVLERTLADPENITFRGAMACDKELRDHGVDTTLHVDTE
jgi:hypothetical protein